ncbi:MAG: cyclic nucleotide-binding domain-containing protein [Roseiflexaceae bacterium]
MGGSTDTRHQDAQRQRAAQAAHQAALVRQEQVALLATLDCLASVPQADLSKLCGIATMRSFTPGSLLIDERIPNNYLYLILHGTICLRLHDRAGREVLIGFLGRGDCFGEGVLFDDRFRSASAQAETTCYLLQLPLEQLTTLLDQSPTLATRLQAIYHERLVASTLGRVPLFGQLSPLARAEIAEMLRAVHYARGEFIIREGAPGEALYLIESGQVAVERSQRLIAHLDEGDFFGEMSLLTNEPHNADVRALTPTDVLVLPADAFQGLICTQPVLAEQIHAVVANRRQANLVINQDTSHSERLAVAIQHGMLRGRHVLVRDPSRCLDGCRICVDACRTRHGSPRLQVNHLEFQGLDITKSCRQCRVGAECIDACPEHALQWNDQGALIVTDACTGCGACVPACPYDAIHLSPHGNQHTSPLWALFQHLKKLGNPTIPLEAAKPTHRAAKCDLCHGHSDLACVSACPTGALRLMPIEEVFPI